MRKMGYDLVRYTPRFHPLARRKSLCDSYGIESVLDVGANVGQYAMELRSIGYKGKIFSFEPLSAAYKELRNNAEFDKLWKTYNFALGNTCGNVSINIAGNSYSSSILDMLPSHERYAPASKYIGKENIKIKTLDSLFESLEIKGENVLLKIDTQGFEKDIIEGSKNSLAFIETIQVEMSLIPLYKGSILFDDMHDLLQKKGFSVVSLEPGFSDDATGRLLQVDGIFHRF